MKKKVFMTLLALSFVLTLAMGLSACSDIGGMLTDYKLTVSYDLNGGEWATGDEDIADQVVTYGAVEDVHFTAQQPIKTGYVFGGWNLQLKLEDAKAIIVAAWLDIDFESITDEDGEPITVRNAGLDPETGLPTVMPKRASSYIDENGDGEQAEDEPVIEYEFTGWEKTIGVAGVVEVRPNFIMYIKVYIGFDFNGGFPSTIVNGTNPANLETNYTWSASPCTETHYYQKKQVTISSVNGGLFEGVTKDDRLANKAVDQISIPVRQGYVFDGWAVEYHDSPSVIYNATDTHVFNYNATTGVYSSPTNSFNQSQKPGKLVYYAQWREDVPQTVPVRVRFCFNDGMPTTDGTTLATPNQQWENSLHYYEDKTVQAVHIGSTHYQVSVSEDRNANATVDMISIPARTGYIFTGWTIGSHTGSVVLYNPTDVYSYVYDMTVTPDEQLVVFYAQWRASGASETKKFIIQYIEDNTDAETANNYNTANTNSISYGTNPQDGIWFEDGVAAGGTITAPTQSPTGVTLGGVPYIFDYWTLDPTASTPVNFFTATAHTTADLTDAFNIYAGVKLAKLYAVYKSKDGVASEGTKGMLLFIEDCNDFNTGDGDYFADPSHTQYSQSLTDGIFKVVYGFYGTGITATSISFPNPAPNGGTLTAGSNSFIYNFGYWTLDPTVATPVNFFATHQSATLNNIPMDNNQVGRLYAVYVTRSATILNSWRKDVSPTTEADGITAPYAGRYQIRVICNDYDNGTPPNCALNVTTSSNTTGTPVATVTPLTYGTYYSTNVFTVANGETIKIEYFLPHNANVGQYFDIELIYLGV